DDRGQHRVRGRSLVLVEGDDDGQPPGPVVGTADDRRQPLVQPVVGGAQRAVVRVVAQVRCQPADGGQRAGGHVVVQRTGRRAAGRNVVRLAVGAFGGVGEVGPRVVPDGVPAAAGRVAWG